MAKQLNVGIYIYEQAEVLDFSGPFEVFATANRVSNAQCVFNTFLVSEQGGVVKARADYQVLSQYSISNHCAIDVLIVAGGVHYDEMNKTEVLAWISAQAEQATIVASVCTGVFLLAKANVVSDHAVTTHWQDIDELKAMFPRLHVKDNVRWVDQGRVITSAGISAGIDMSLYIVEKLLGKGIANATAKQMEFDRKACP